MNKTIWLGKLLLTHHGLTKQEILDAWRQEDDRGRPMAESTFFANRNNLQDYFGLPIVCKDGRYFLGDLYDAEAGKVLRRMLAGPSDNEHVHLDTEPVNAALIPTVMEAVTERITLHIAYRPFDKEGYETDVNPLVFNVYRGRWYITGPSSRHDAVRTFASDRIVTLRPTGLRFRRPPRFQPGQLMQYCYGAFPNTTIAPAHIVLKVSLRVAPYFRTTPLHHSQSELPPQDPEREAHFAFDLSPTPDFIGQVLSWGPEVEVVSPESLRAQVAALLRETLGRY